MTRYSAADFDILAGLLRSAGTVRLREVAEGTAGPGIALRHDVDYQWPGAMQLARWEAGRGIRATYFVLPWAGYASTPDFGRDLRELDDLGHEVGIHNNAVILADGALGRAAEIMRDQLEYLRNQRVSIIGAADHGSPAARKRGIYNNRLWLAYRPADFGLLYEAYELHETGRYVSDLCPEDLNALRLNPVRRLHLLVHPCHWQLP